MDEIYDVIVVGTGLSALQCASSIVAAANIRVLVVGCDGSIGVRIKQVLYTI